MGQLVAKEFRAQCLAFPARVDAALAEVKTLREAKGMLDQAAAMQHYAERLKAGIEIERPIAIGVLKIKAKIGELLPAKPPANRGQGRNGKKSGNAALLDLSKPALSAYRKLAAHVKRIDEYAERVEDVPTQGDFIRFCTGAHVKNNSGENEWYTPAEYIEAARKVMGGITLDPASTKAANEVVKAKRFYTADDDALSKTWAGNIWLNPPYAKDLIGLFADKVATEKVDQACVLVNNATETQWFQKIASASSAICFPAGRVKFWSTTRDTTSPLQGQAVLYIGKRHQSFCSEFKVFGFCVLL